MTISFHDYKIFTASTWAPAPIIHTKEVDILHCICGLSGENLELQLAEDDETHILEEMSDLMYYLTRLGEILGYDGDPLPEDDLEWEVELEKFINLAKKSIFYQHEDVDLFDAYVYLLAAYNELLDSKDLEWETVMAFNHRKLSARYPNGFTSQAAADRADKRSEDSDSSSGDD